jgi:hypothetical protein
MGKRMAMKMGEEIEKRKVGLGRKNHPTGENPW